LPIGRWRRPDCSFKSKDTSTEFAFASDEQRRLDLVDRIPVGRLTNLQRPSPVQTASLCDVDGNTVLGLVEDSVIAASFDVSNAVSGRAPAEGWMCLGGWIYQPSRGAPHRLRHIHELVESCIIKERSGFRSDGYAFDRGICGLKISTVFACCASQRQDDSFLSRGR